MPTGVFTPQVPTKTQPVLSAKAEQGARQIQHLLQQLAESQGQRTGSEVGYTK